MATKNDVSGRPYPPRQLTPRQIASRNEVLIAAADAFTERGYAATSIDDIADRLGATKGRIYHHFRTKGEIFVGIHRRALDISFEMLRLPSTTGETATERLHNMAVAHATLMMNDFTFMHLAVRHAEMELVSEGRTRQEDIDEILELRRRYEAQFERVIAEGISSGDFADRDSYLMAKAVLGTLNWMSVWYSPRPEHSDEYKKAIATDLADFVTNGLKPDPGNAA